MRRKVYKVPVDAIDDIVTPEDIAKVQEAIDWRLQFYHANSYATVIVIDEENRVTHPILAFWLEPQHADTLRRMTVYSKDREPEDYEDSAILQTIRDAIDEVFGARWSDELNEWRKTDRSQPFMKWRRNH